MNRIPEYPFPCITSLRIVHKYSGDLYALIRRGRRRLRGTKLVPTSGGVCCRCFLTFPANSEKRHGRAVGCISFLPPLYCQLTCRPTTGGRFQVRELRLTAAVQHAGAATLALKSRRERSEIAQTGCVTFLTSREAAWYIISVV